MKEASKENERKQEAIAPEETQSRVYTRMDQILTAPSPVTKIIFGNSHVIIGGNHYFLDLLFSFQTKNNSKIIHFNLKLFFKFNEIFYE